MLITHVNLNESNDLKAGVEEKKAEDMPETTSLFVSNKEQIDSYADIIIELLMMHMKDHTTDV